MGMGNRIRSLREQMGLSQEQLVESLGISFQAVSGWERGIGLPDTNRLCDLARALRTSIAQLMGESTMPVD